LSVEGAYGVLKNIAKRVPHFETVLVLGLIVVLFGVIVSYFSFRTPPEVYKYRRLGETLAVQGRDGVPGCAGCHGQKGEGNPQAGFPRLAGLPAPYIIKQLEDFARDEPLTGAHFDPIARDYSKTPRIDVPLSVLTPGTRRDVTMSPIAKSLTADERTQLGHYYASLAFKATPVPGDPETLERGEDLVLRGKPEYGVPGCFSCHGQNGVGVGAVFPPIAGQPAQYTIEQINRWQSGARDNDENALMRSIAIWMTDGDKHYVAAYLANLSHEVKDGRPVVR
jgi:cytochrome c553